MTGVTAAGGNDTVELTVMLHSTTRLFDRVVADYDDGGHISVFGFGGGRKKSKKFLVIMVHGSLVLCIDRMATSQRQSVLTHHH